MISLTNFFFWNGFSLASYNLPVPPDASHIALNNRLVIEELEYDVQQLSSQALSIVCKLIVEQQLIYDTIIDVVLHDKPCFYFVSGHGGTEKTYLWNAIITELRSRGQIVLVVASSGVAALLLPSGRTAHSWFRILVDIDDRSLCVVHRGTMLVELIRKCSLILWDEDPMALRRCFEALDRTIRDILAVDNSTNATKPFGGKTIVLSGDFRQVLPVVQGGGRNEIVGASLLKSNLWNHVQILHLTINMQLNAPGISLQQQHELASFAQWVLDIGEVRVPAQRCAPL